MVDTRPKPYVFVLMPFDGDFDDVYKLGIKQACENAGAYAERVDEQIFQESILQRIYNQIDKADIIVADMTGRNPNVFYETGYAHALGKHVILLTRNADDIPFDLKHYTHIVYGGRIADLIPELEKRIKWVLDNPGKGAVPPESTVQFYIDGKSLAENPTITLMSGPTSNIWLKVDAHNSDEKEIRSASFQVALITSNRFKEIDGERGMYLNMVRLPDETHIFLRDDSFSIFPGAWESFRFSCYTTKALEVGAEEQMILRMFSGDGRRDFPFVFKLEANAKRRV